MHGRNSFVFKFKRYLLAFISDYSLYAPLKTNHKTEVLNKLIKPIPGLYAVGSDANTMYEDTYPGYLSGNTTSFAYTTGLMAVKNATEYISALL